MSKQFSILKHIKSVAVTLEFRRTFVRSAKCEEGKLNPKPLSLPSRENDKMTEESKGQSLK